MKTVVFVCALLATCLAQRSPYAGRQPIGYPAVVEETTTEGLSERFGEEVTTIKLPIEALGDAKLVERLLKLPTDKQPFWLINWQALEANRLNPQTFNPNPNSFMDNQGSDNQG